jgi:hypothetical protein
MSIWNGLNEIVDPKKIRLHFVALSVYVVLSIIFTYPVLFLKNSIPGYGDAFWYLWDLWWYKTALLNFSNPYYTQYIFHPVGVNLALSEVSPFNALVSVPLQLLFGLSSSYKIIWIGTFILSGYGTFLLVKYLTDDEKAAFVSGLIFMFCPYRFSHSLGHLNLLSTEWIPFYVLFLIKSLNEDRRSNAIYAALFFFLTAICSYYYIPFLVILTLMYLIYRQTDKRGISDGAVIRRIALMITVSSMAVAPFLYPLLKEMLTAKSGYAYGGGYLQLSSDLLSFFIPSGFHPMYRNVLPLEYPPLAGGEYVFIGYSVILLSFLAFFKSRLGDSRFWGLSAFAFFVLCLGPILQINGQKIYLPLPYAIIMHIPIFSLARAPGRWDILLVLSLAILSGYGFNYLTKNYNSLLKNSLLIFFSLLILFEFLTIPLAVSSLHIPAFYEQMAKDAEDYSLLEIPSEWGEFISYADYMYFQTPHQKRLVTGYASRVPESVLDFFTSLTYLNNLMDFSQKDIIDTDPNELAAIVELLNIKYIIIHKDRLSDEDLINLQALLKGTLNETPMTFEDDSLIVYPVEKRPRMIFNPHISLGEGWNNLENWTGTPTRWMKDCSTIIINSEMDRTMKLDMRALSFSSNKNIKICLDGVQQLEDTVSTTSFVHLSAPINIHSGNNTLRIEALEGCQRPCNILDLGNEDPRCISIAIQNISLSESQR